MKWAYSVTVVRRVGWDQEVRTLLAYVQADTQAEALGKAIQHGRLCYPPGQGWTNHYAQVRSTDEPAMEPGQVVYQKDEQR